MSEPEITEITSGLGFPEGPVWMPDGTVLVVEMKHRRITRVHPDGRKETAAEPGGSPNGLAIGPDGALYVCNSGGWDYFEVGDWTIPMPELPAHHSGGRIERVDLDTGDVKVLYTECDGHPLIGPNDLVFDAHGGMWFTDHARRDGRIQHVGAIYYARPDGSSIREVVFATLVTGALTVISPAGEVLDQVMLGDPMVTNVCFGGDDLRTAYATLSASGRLVSIPWPRPGHKLNY